MCNKTENNIKFTTSKMLEILLRKFICRILRRDVRADTEVEDHLVDQEFPKYRGLL